MQLSGSSFHSPVVDKMFAETIKALHIVSSPAVIFMSGLETLHVASVLTWL